jgi:hypothetical protein
MGVAITAGGTASYTFSVAPVNGFKDSIGFTCAGPVGSSCSVSPTQVAMDGTTSPTVKVYVNTNGGNGTSAKSTPLQVVPKSIFFALLPFSMMGMLLVGKRRSFGLVLILLVFCLVMGLASCGSSSGGSSSGALAPGSYQVTVTATSTGTPAVTHIVSLNLVVSKQ